MGSCQLMLVPRGNVTLGYLFMIRGTSVTNGDTGTTCYGDIVLFHLLG